VASVDYIVKGMASLTDTDRLLREISAGMLALVKERIHREGQRITGTSIGTYSDAYLRVREKSGKGTDTKMIFALTGSMENNFKIIAISDTEYGLGFDNPTEIIKVTALIKGQSAHTVKAHTRKGKEGKVIEVKSYQNKGSKGFGDDIYALSESELEEINTIVQGYTNEAFK
jgi:hypothetical protein